MGSKEISLSFVKIHELKNKELINSFSCGNLIIDEFLKNHSYDFDQSITYLLIENDKKLVGFYSLICSSLLEISDKNIIVSSAPSIEIKMFAIDNAFQDKLIPVYEHTYAHFMLDHCIEDIKKISNHIGATYIILNATKEGYELYSRVGNFTKIDEDYLLPDWKSDKDAIRMAREIRPKV